MHRRFDREQRREVVARQHRLVELAARQPDAQLGRSLAKGADVLHGHVTSEMARQLDATTDQRPEPELVRHLRLFPVCSASPSSAILS